MTVDSTGHWNGDPETRPGEVVIRLDEPTEAFELMPHLVVVRDYLRRDGPHALKALARVARDRTGETATTS